MSPAYRYQLFQKGMKIGDTLSICLAALTALAVTAQSFTWLSLAQLLFIRVKLINAVLLCGYLIVCSIVFSRSGLYQQHRLPVLEWVRRIVLAVLQLAAILFLMRSPLGLAFATDTFLLFFAIFSLCTLILYRIMVRLVTPARLNGKGLCHVVIIGDSEGTNDLSEHLTARSEIGYRLLRTIQIKEVAEGEPLAGSF